MISIHTLAWRVTKSPASLFASSGHFNPHPRVEGDEFVHVAFVDAHNFNPHPRVEGDSNSALFVTIPLYFNPHPRVEGDTC